MLQLKPNGLDDNVVSQCQDFKMDKKMTENVIDGTFPDCREDNQ